MNRLLLFGLIFFLTTPTQARDFSKTNFNYTNLGVQGGSVMLKDKIQLGEDTYHELTVWGIAANYQLPNNVILGINKSFADGTRPNSSIKTENTGFILGYAFSMDGYDLYGHLGQYRSHLKVCYAGICDTQDKITYGADLGSRIAAYKDLELGVNLKVMDIAGNDMHAVLGIHQSIDMTPNSNLIITQQINSNDNFTLAVGTKLKF